MVNFFIEGGSGMFPVLILGIILVVSSIRYMIDGDPIRLRFFIVLSLALLTATTFAVLTDVSKVMAFLAREREPRFAPDQYLQWLAEGLKESSRPAVLGFGMFGLALDLVAVGYYRVGRRELRAARG
jgi:hypothetical protein